MKVQKCFPTSVCNEAFSVKTLLKNYVTDALLFIKKCNNKSALFHCQNVSNSGGSRNFSSI